jgi:hypothetical protein
VNDPWIWSKHAEFRKQFPEEALEISDRHLKALVDLQNAACAVINSFRGCIGAVALVEPEAYEALKKLSHAAKEVRESHLAWLEWEPDGS